MRFGIAKDLITPTIVTYLGGYASFRSDTFEGIHDDLYVKAVLLDDGRTKVLLVTLDLLFYERALHDKVTAYARERHGIPPECVIVSCQHTHAAPACMGYDIGLASPEYDAFLLARIKTCIDRVFVNTFEGTMHYGSVEGDWNINRRGKVDGKVVMRPHPDGGPKENHISILKLTDTAGRVRGILLNYGCHPVTLRDQLYLSAEYPGRLCQLLETQFYGSTVAFFQGAGGSARPRLTAKNGVFVKCTYDEVDDMALAMANNVQKAVHSCDLRPIALNLAARHFVIPLDIEPYSKAELQAAVDRAKNPAPSKTAKNGQEFYANAARHVLARYDSLPNALDLHCGIIRLSDDLYIAHMGGEPCYEVKQVIAPLFGDKTMLLFGYTDATAYIVDDAMLADGGYEPTSALEYANKGNFKPGLDEKYRAAFREHLRHIATAS